MGCSTTRFVPSHKLADRNAQVSAPGANTIKDKQSPPPSLVDLGSGNTVEEIVQVTLPREKTRKPALHQSLSQGEVKRLVVFNDLRKLHNTKVPIFKFATFLGDKFNSATSQPKVSTHSMSKVRTEWSVLLDQIGAWPKRRFSSFFSETKMPEFILLKVTRNCLRTSSWVGVVKVTRSSVKYL